MGTKAETDTLHEPTWQVRACRHTFHSMLPLIVALPLFQILRLPSHWHRLRAQPALGVQAFTIYGACVCFAVCVFYTVVEKDDPLARGLYIPCPDHYKNYCVHGDCQFPNILAQPSCRYTQIGTWRNLGNNQFLNTKTVASTYFEVQMSKNVLQTLIRPWLHTSDISCLQGNDRILWWKLSGLTNPKQRPSNYTQL